MRGRLALLRDAPGALLGGLGVASLSVGLPVGMWPSSRVASGQQLGIHAPVHQQRGLLSWGGGNRRTPRVRWPALGSAGKVPGACKPHQAQQWVGTPAPELCMRRACRALRFRGRGGKGDASSRGAVLPWRERGAVILDTARRALRRRRVSVGAQGRRGPFAGSDSVAGGHGHWLWHWRGPLCRRLRGLPLRRQRHWGRRGHEMRGRVAARERGGARRRRTRACPSAARRRAGTLAAGGGGVEPRGCRSEGSLRRGDRARHGGGRLASATGWLAMVLECGQSRGGRAACVDPWGPREAAHGLRAGAHTGRVAGAGHPLEGPRLIRRRPPATARRQEGQHAACLTRTCHPRRG
mmetsp:Transcript_24469/g.92439  ORF Transcript_24469/g.92439 Transcript_24469/m.92439 type:complete len:352 (-) Transcript_24469:1038-2093(-)